MWHAGTRPSTSHGAWDKSVYSATILGTLPLTRVNPAMGNAHKCIDGKSDGILAIRWLQASESAALYLNEITNDGVFVLLLPYSEAKPSERRC